MTKSASDPEIVAKTLAERNVRQVGGVAQQIVGYQFVDAGPLVIAPSELIGEYVADHTAACNAARRTPDACICGNAAAVAKYRENLQPLMADLPDKPTGLPSLDQLTAEYDARRLRRLAEQVQHLQDDVRRLDQLVNGFIGLFKKLGAIDPDGGVR